MVDLKQEGVDIVIGYVISWAYVLAVLSFLQDIFGKTKGILIAYGSSFLVWYMVLYGLNQRHTI